MNDPDFEIMSTLGIKPHLLGIAPPPIPIDPVAFDAAWKDVLLGISSPPPNPYLMEFDRLFERHCWYVVLVVQSKDLERHGYERSADDIQREAVIIDDSHSKTRTVSVDGCIYIRFSLQPQYKHDNGRHLMVWDYWR